MARVFIGVGSNVGDRAAHLAAARNGLARLPRTRLVKWSGVYETAPVGPIAQDHYLNAAAELETSLEPADLLAGMAAIEAAEGREPRDRRVHWGPRTLDLDILFYDQRVIHEKSLDVPHPRLHERQFVLKPLADLDPAFVHPALDKSVAQLLAELEEVEVSGKSGAPCSQVPDHGSDLSEKH